MIPHILAAILSIFHHHPASHPLTPDYTPVQAHQSNTDYLLQACSPGQRLRAKREYIDILFANPQEFTKRGMNTKLILVQYMAQVMEETDCFYEIAEMHTKPGQYDGRMGNKQGEGYTYRGRGLLQLTGKENYQRIGGSLGQDWIKHPEALETPYWSMVSSLEYWDLMGLNKYASEDDVREVTRLINGGYNGLAVREAYLKKLKQLYHVS